MTQPNSKSNFWLVGQLPIHGGNFKLKDHVTSQNFFLQFRQLLFGFLFALIPLSFQKCTYLTLGVKEIQAAAYNGASTVVGFR